MEYRCFPTYDFDVAFPENILSYIVGEWGA